MTEDIARAAEFERLAKILESSGEYRILRRLRSSALPSSTEMPRKRGLFLDVETTGLDASKDTVIELAMLPFEYDMDGCVVGVGDAFVSFRDPGILIPPDVTALTGITDEMVAGTSIDPEQIEAAVGAAAIVIAHNAGFDRPFCERLWPAFAAKPWGCSLREVDWKAEGFEGTKLRDIAAGHGFFFDSHRAEEDCRAGIEILTRRLPKSGRTGLAALLESARQTRWRLWATGAPFASREILKKRGYRWDPGNACRPRAWYMEVSDQTLECKRHFLKSRIMHGGDEILSISMTAFDRYSDRVCPGSFPNRETNG